MTSLTIGSHIETIGAYAFYGCYALQLITLLAVPQTINIAAFALGTDERTVLCQVKSPDNIANGVLDAFKGDYTVFIYSPLAPPTTYEYLRINNNKIQVDSAIRDGNGVRIDTNYTRSDLTNLALHGVPSDGDTIVWKANEYRWAYGSGSGDAVRDVILNGESVVTNNIAVIPITATRIRMAELE